MTERPYLFNTELKIWVTSSHDGTSYSDGDAAEQRLLSALEQCRNVSVASEELRAHITDWPSEYHLSPARHNLLRPFTFGPSHSILELGCGCGAMTRYLGETGAKVVAVEGSRRRAAITAERCRDLPNVSVYCDNLIDFQADNAFDFVTLIGVLEYSNQFISGPDPVHVCLKKAGNFLTKDGALILAIENQLGLKYFNGCNEDHLGIPYFGINGLYRKEDPVTFGRHVLIEKLSESGFPVHEFFYPFPDYKLPGLILSEGALRDGRLNVADLLIHNTGRNYPETNHRAFSEDLAWRVAVENGLVAELANSFLVIARPTGSKSTPTNWLAKIYSRGRRYPRYQVESTIARDETGSLEVHKRKLFPEASADEKWLRHFVSDSTYLAGNLLVSKIHKAMAREAGIEELAICFGPWLKFLRAHAAKDEKGEHMLPGNFVDCIPANLIETASGELLYFDAEWVSKDPIPFEWTVIRGIINSLIDCLENRTVSTMTYRQCISYIAEKSGINLHENDFSTADQYETRLVAQCHSDSSSKPRLTDFLDSSLFLTFRLANVGPELAWHRAELGRVKSTFSWRITAPLRIIWNLALKLAANLR